MGNSIIPFITRIFTFAWGQNQLVAFSRSNRAGILLSMLIGVAVPQATAQSEIAKISIPKEIKLEHVQAFGVGDSLFVAYEEFQYPVRRRVGTWIIPRVEPQLFLLNEFPDAVLVNVTSRGDRNIFYFIDGKQEPVLRMVQMHGSEKKALPEFLTLQGSYLGSFKDNYLHVLCLDKKDDMIRCYVVDDLKLIADHQIPFPSITKNIKAKRIEFFDGKVNMSSGSARIKVIQDEKILYIIDENFNYGRAVICEVDLTTYEYNISEFDWPTSQAWTTFVSKEILYKLNGSPKATILELYDIRTKERIRSLHINFAGPNGVGYARSGKDHITGKMSEFKPFRALLDVRASLTVTNLPGEYTLAKVGRYIESQSSFPINATSPTSLALSGGLIMASEGLSLLAEPEGTNSFVYRIVDPRSESIQLADAVDFLSRKVDEYEAHLSARIDMKLRGYIILDHSLVAMYLFNNELKFVKFDR